MKNLKYIIVAAAVSLFLGGCAEDSYKVAKTESGNTSVRYTEVTIDGYVYLVIPQKDNYKGLTLKGNSCNK